MLITAGLYCSRNGIENKSFTFSTTIPMVCCCPTFRVRLRGSNRICAAFVPLGAVVGAPKEGGAVGGAPVEGGTAFGERTSVSRRTCTCDSEPVYSGRKFARVHSGMRTMCGVSMIRISSSSLLCVSSEQKYRKRGLAAEPRPPVNALRIASCYQPAQNVRFAFFQANFVLNLALADNGLL